MKTQEKRLLNIVQRSDVYEEVLIESCGVPIALSIWKGNAGAPCIVFLPATMTHPLFFEELLSSLNLAGYNIVGVHFQGHGKSPRVKRLFSFNDMVQNGRDAISYACERFKSPIVVFGSSQGGMVATSLAASDDRITVAFAHNIMDPWRPDSIRITNFPQWLQPFHGFIVRAMNFLAHVVPRLRIPLQFYLREKRVFKTERVLEQYHQDPLGLTSYPLYFLASLFSADMHSLYTGQIKCPVIVIAATGDPLFFFDYTQSLYQGIKAPAKELLVYELDYHLLFNECFDEVLPRLLEKLHEYAPVERAILPGKEEIAH